MISRARVGLITAFTAASAIVLVEVGAGAPRPLSGTDNDEEALRDHVKELERLTADGGVLIASNGRYADEDQGQTHYGPYHRAMPGGMSAQGCLWGERDGEVVGV